MDALAIFRLVATEFADMPDDDVIDGETGKVKAYGVNSFLELYSDQISEKRFGSTYQKALAYLTAHKLKMSGYGNNENGKIGDSLRVGSYSEGESSQYSFCCSSSRCWFCTTSPGQSRIHFAPVSLQFAAASVALWDGSRQRRSGRKTASTNWRTASIRKIWTIRMVWKPCRNRRKYAVFD